MAREPHSVGEILDGLNGLADKNRKVSIGDVVEEFGRRSYGPFLLVPALIELTPIGGIPGVPTFLAVVIALVAVQLLIGRKNLYLPDFISNRSVSSEKLRKAIDKLLRVARVMDKVFKNRFPVLAEEPMPRIAAGIVVLLCCTVPPLEFLPFASSAPMLTIACFGLALMVRDGLLMAIAFSLTLGTVVLGFSLLSTGGGGG